jgi:hypothetical protein
MRAPAAAARAQGRAAGKPGAAPVARPTTERPFYETVLAAIKKLGKADIAAIVAELERQRFPPPERLEHAVGDAIYASLKVKGLVEPVEDERGWWRAVKP